MQVGNHNHISNSPGSGGKFRGENRNSRGGYQ